MFRRWGSSADRDTNVTWCPAEGHTTCRHVVTTTGPTPAERAVPTRPWSPRLLLPTHGRTVLGCAGTPHVRDAGVSADPRARLWLCYIIGHHPRIRL